MLFSKTDEVKNSHVIQLQVVLLYFLFVVLFLPLLKKNKDIPPISLPWDTSGNQIKEQIKILVLALTK